MKRLAMTMVVLTTLLAASPAWAHEEINPKSFPTGAPTFFSLSASNEQKADLTKVTLTAPAGVNFGATTKEPPGWTLSKTDSVLTWTGGAVKPDKFEQWGYEIDSADQPGNLTYKVTLGFADGKSDDVNVVVTAVAGGTTATTAATALGSSATPTTVVKATGPIKKDEGRANAALGIGIAALVLALVAGGLALRRRNGTVAAAPEQDW
jgi:uncharacterized protein YcnI